MALKIDAKKAIVAEVSEVAGQAITAAAADYRGLTVSQMTQLRVNARKADVYLKVIRNTLARRALEGTDFECLRDTLVGPIILAFASNEPSAPARLFKDFMKENEQLIVRALVVGGKLHEAGNLDMISKLPTREEAIAKLMGLMKAPISKFVRTLAEPQAKLVRTIAAIKDQKQAAA